MTKLAMIPMECIIQALLDQMLPKAWFDLDLLLDFF